LKTILITGGASGLGKGLALNYLSKGDRVISIGESAPNGELFLQEAKQLNATDEATFIQANLSLVKENRRIVEEIKNRFQELDALIFCASRHCKERMETAEGLEFSFALDYLSRFILSYELKECLEKTKNPTIINVCGTGMSGNVNWGDLQHKNSFSPMKVMMHGSRLNDLSGVAFAHNDTTRNIKYALYNPMAVQTPGMMDFANFAMKLYYKLAAKPIEKAILPVIELVDNPSNSTIAAYKERKSISLNLPTYNIENAKKLLDMTTQLLESI